MDKSTAHDMEALGERFGADATYVIMQDDRLLVFTPEGEQTIRARMLGTDGEEIETDAREALSSLRDWVEGHRLD